MNLKGYIKFVIMALAIMFLSVNIVSSTESILSQTNNNTAAITAFLQSSGVTSGQTFTLYSSDNSNIASIDYIRLKMARVAGDETGFLYFNVSLLNDDDTQGKLLSTDAFDISTLSTTVTWTTIKSTSLDLNNASGTRYLLSYSCSCDHITAVRFGGYAPSTTDNGRYWVSTGGIVDQDLAYEIGYSFLNTDSTYIYFDNTNYNIYDTGTLMYNVDTNFWNEYVYKYYRVFINNEYPETEEIYYIYNSGQDQVQFTKLGRYDAYIKQTGILGKPSDSDTIIDQATALVLPNTDNITSDKINYNVSENIKISGYLYPDDLSNNIGYIWLQADGSSNYDQYSFNVKYPYTFSRTYNLNAGNYNFTLMKYKNYGVCKGTNYILSCFYSSGFSQRVIVTPSLKTNGYGNISIKWNNNQGLINSLQTLNFTNATWRDTIYIYDNLNITFGVYDTDKYNYQMDILIPNDNSKIGIWKAKIVNSSNTNEFNWSNISIVSKSMMNYTNDFGVTIDFDQDEGNGGMHGVRWYTGSYRGNYSIRLIELKNGQVIKEDNYNSSSTQTQTGNYYLDTNYEYYQIQFVDNNFLILSSANIKIIDWKENKINGGTNVGESYGLGEDKSDTAVINNLLILIGMPIFWGLVFIGYITYYLKNSPNLILPSLFILINVEAVVGLLEPYTTYIVVVTWLIIAMNFIFVQKKTTG